MRRPGMNLVAGVKLGLLAATCFSVLTIALRLIGGSKRFEEFGISWLDAVLTYYGAFALGGLLVGLLLPLRRFALGSITLGFVGVFPAYAAFTVQLRRRDELGAGDLLLAIVFSAVVGGAVGYTSWREDQKQRT